MAFRRIALAVSVLVFLVPAMASAQSAPVSQVVITTVLAPGVSAPSAAPIVTVTATAPSLTGVSNSSASTLSYASNFANDTRTVSFIPGSYVVSANGPGYYFSYSPDCTGFTPLNGATKSCTITLSTTPPPPPANCTTVWYGSAGCVAPVVPYQGPLGQAPLTCSPSYQAIGAGQTATFVAQGGTPGGYNWTTADRTFLNVGSNLTTVFQSTGTQTVIVQNGVQSATCTVNVVADGGAITYAGAPSVVSSYVPALFPNTGFEPQNGAVLALSLVLLLSAGILLAPHVRKAFAYIG